MQVITKKPSVAEEVEIVYESSSPPSILSQEDSTSATSLPYTSQSSTSTFSYFSKKQRIFILVCISLTNVLAALTVHIYYPALPALQKSFDTSALAVNASVSVYKLIQAFWPPFIASITDVMGRRLLYLLSAPITMGSCVGLALSPTITCLIGLRVCQALGMSPLYVTGFGVIGDIVDPSSRSIYISLYCTVFRVFTLLGPTIGGAILTHFSWRFNFWFLLCISSVVFPIIVLFLPETIPSLRKQQENKTYSCPVVYCISNFIVKINCARRHHKSRKHHQKEQKQWASQQKQISTATDTSTTITTVQQHPSSYAARIKSLSLRDFTMAFRNLTKLHILVTLLLVGLYNAAQDCFNITTAELLSTHFGLNEQMVGLCYLAQSTGSIVGGLFSGVYLRYWFNRAIRLYKKRNNNNDQGESIQESIDIVMHGTSTLLPYDFPLCKVRLLPVSINAFLVQVTTGLYGWCYVWNAPLPVLLCLQFLAGMNIAMVDSANNTLLMDFRPQHAASVGASSALFNQGFGAIASFCIHPIIQAVGVGYAFTMISSLLVTGNFLILLLFKYDAKWREMSDKKHVVQ